MVLTTTGLIGLARLGLWGRGFGRHGCAVRVEGWEGGPGRDSGGGGVLLLLCCCSGLAVSL